MNSKPSNKHTSKYSHLWLKFLCELELLNIQVRTELVK